VQVSRPREGITYFGRLLDLGGKAAGMGKALYKNEKKGNKRKRLRETKNKKKEKAFNLFLHFQIRIGGEEEDP